MSISFEPLPQNESIVYIAGSTLASLLTCGAPRRALVDTGADGHLHPRGGPMGPLERSTRTQDLCFSGCVATCVNPRSLEKGWHQAHSIHIHSFMGPFVDRHRRHRSKGRGDGPVQNCYVVRFSPTPTKAVVGTRVSMLFVVSLSTRGFLEPT